MRILHVISTIAGRAGGPPKVLAPLVGFQARLGHQVTVCTTNTDYPTGIIDVKSNSAVEENGVEFWYHSVDFRPLLYSNSMRVWLKRHLREFDIVHIHGLYRFPVSFSAALARRLGISYVIQPHGALDLFLYKRSSRSLLLKRLYERFMEFPNLNAAARIIVTSQDEQSRVEEFDFRASCALIPNGLNLAEYQRLPARGAFRRRFGIADDAPLVLFLGRLNFKKGLDFLIPAFSRLCKHQPKARLAIVGPDNEGFKAKVIAWCRAANVLDKTVMIDYLEADWVRQAYVDADVFALSSYTENFGLTVIEAMVCRCPVVVSDQVNIHAEVREVDAGIVTSLDSLEIAQALERILGDKALALAMGRRGRNMVKRKFDWEPLADVLDGVYLQIGDERGGRS